MMLLGTMAHARDLGAAMQMVRRVQADEFPLEDAVWAFVSVASRGMPAAELLQWVRCVCGWVYVFVGVWVPGCVCSCARVCGCMCVWGG